MPTLARKLYPSIATLPSKYKTILDVEAYIFPITRKSHGKAVHEGYFQEVMKFVAELSRYLFSMLTIVSEKIVPKF
jgi:hypothetical protein